MNSNFDKVKEEEEENTGEKLFKKKMRKIDIKDKRRVIKNYKRCLFDEADSYEESLMKKINKIEGITDYYRTFYYNL